MHIIMNNGYVESLEVNGSHHDIDQYCDNNNLNPTKLTQHLWDKRLVEFI